MYPLPQSLHLGSQLQVRLSLFNRRRLEPGAEIEWEQEAAGRRLESDFLARELSAIQPLVGDVPTEAAAFVRWFESLKEWGPGQADPLFPYLAERATLEEMRWFIGQEVAGEAGFDDLVALTQVRMPARVKLELARNYWDEMGRGNEKGMHGPMLAQLAEELGVSGHDPEQTVPEALALGNLMVALALNRAFAFHSVGSLGVVELTAPDRARAVYQGLKRLGVSPAGQRYYLLHSTLDVQHSIAWNREALLPLIAARPDCARAVAEGALLRLRAGQRCFERYRENLGIPRAIH